MTDDVELTVGEVKTAIKFLLEEQLAQMKVEPIKDNIYDKLVAGGILLAKDTLTHFVDHFCSVLDSAAKVALEEDQDQ